MLVSYSHMITIIRVGFFQVSRYSEKLLKTCFKIGQTALVQIKSHLRNRVEDNVFKVQGSWPTNGLALREVHCSSVVQILHTNMNLTAESHRIPLSDGNSIPLVGLGTYGDPQTTPKGTARDCVKLAIDVGYRHFDGALVYFNEHEVGQAIREKLADGTVRREDIFYCGKLWNTFHPPELVRPALERTLKALKLDYVDLYIIELPMAFKPGKGFYPKDQVGNYIYHHTDLCATWEALEACKDAGLVKSLGVSNFNRRQLELLLNKPGLKHKPVSNQVECHPYFTQPKLLEYCRQNDIVIVGYCPIGSSRDVSWVNLKCPPLLDDEVLVSIGKKYNKSSAQVALRFNIQRGVVVIPKSFNPERIKHNFQIFDFSLTEEEMKAIEALNKNIRFVELLMWSDHPEYPFHDEY